MVESFSDKRNETKSPPFLGVVGLVSSQPVDSSLQSPTYPEFCLTVRERGPKRTLRPIHDSPLPISPSNPPVLETT